MKVLILPIIILLCICGNAWSFEVQGSGEVATTTPDCPNIGYTSEGATTGSYIGSDAMAVTNSGVTCVANQICIYASYSGASVDVLLALYERTSAHQPGDLLAETSAIEVTSTVGWYCGTIADTTIDEDSIHYLSWLGESAISYYYDTGTTYAVWKSMTYASGHDDPYGTVGGTIDRDISFYLGHD